MFRITRTLLATLAFSFAWPAVHADTWPSRPIRAIVPIAPGSVTDIVPRIVLEQVSTQLGQAIVIENRPGAGMSIGAAAVAKSTPDGYTWLVTSSAHTIAPSLYANLPYDATRDFIAVIPLGVTPFVLVVSPGRGYKTVGDLIRAAKEKPGSFNFSSPGIGTASHLSAERFRLTTGLQAEHVPFRGGVEAMSEVIAGRIDFFFMAVGAAAPFIREGKLVGLAVNGSERSSSLPDVPTLRESGINDADYPTWVGLFVAANTPPDVVNRLYVETKRALQTPKVHDKLSALGVDPLPMEAVQFEQFVRGAIDSDAVLVKRVGLKPQQ